MTRFSIVTPTYNRAPFLPNAIESALAQAPMDFEHIVVDGASTDNTLDVLRRYPSLIVVSEPDRGLYDAINKGIARATGDVIVLLNSDDTLLPGALAAAASAFAADPDIDMVCGRVHLGRIGDVRHDVVLGTPAMQRLRPGDVISGVTLTNSRFIRREVYERLGGFDLRYPVASDRDFLGRCLLANLRIAIIDRPLYRYGQHGDSLTFGSERMNTKLLDEYLRLALDRLHDAQDSRARSFYLRWATWAAAYRLASGGRERTAEQTLRRLLFRPAALGAFARQVGWHIANRRERRGTPVPARSEA